MTRQTYDRAPRLTKLATAHISKGDHAGEAIIMLLGNYENVANVVAENIIKTRCIRIK